MGQIPLASNGSKNQHKAADLSCFWHINNIIFPLVK